MSAIGLETDHYQDYLVLPGATFAESVSIVPLDLTGCTASMVIKGAGVNGADLSVSVSIAVDQPGAYPTSELSWNVPSTQTELWAAGGVFPYQILVTFADAVTVLPYGHGMVVVRS